MSYDNTNLIPTIATSIPTSGNIHSQHANPVNAVNWDEYIYIIGDASYYSTRFRKYFTNKQIAQNLQAMTGLKIKPEDVDVKLQEGVIKKYFGFCYGEDIEGMYNTFDKLSILQPSKNCDLPEGVLSLFESITGGDTRDMEYLMKAVLYKYLNPTSCQIPAIVLIGAQGTGKTSFARLMGTILGAENVQLNIGQRNIEGKFAPTTNNKLVYELAEMYTTSRAKGVAIANQLKNTLLADEVSYERKYENHEYVKNSAWYIITSNHPMPIILDPNDTENRRYSIFRGETPLGEKAGLVFKTITDKESVSEFLRYLITNFYDEVSKLETFPTHDNSIKRLLADNSTSEFVEYWNELRETEGIGTFISNEAILLKFDRFCEENGYDKKLKMRLLKSCPYTDNRTRYRVDGAQPRGRFITN